MLQGQGVKLLMEIKQGGKSNGMAVGSSTGDSNTRNPLPGGFHLVYKHQRYSDSMEGEPGEREEAGQSQKRSPRQSNKVMKRSDLVR